VGTEHSRADPPRGNLAGTRLAGGAATAASRLEARAGLVTRSG